MTERKATYADLEKLPEHVIGEIIDGRLHAKPRLLVQQQISTSTLGALIGRPFHLGIDGPGGWWIIKKVEIHLGEDVLVPELAGWRTSRLAVPTGPALTVAPDWICEALSPSNEESESAAKLRVYARERVPFAWLVDAFGHTLEAYERDGEQWRLLGSWSGEERVRVRPFEEAELPLGLLWPSELSPEPAGK